MEQLKSRTRVAFVEEKSKLHILLPNSLDMLILSRFFIHLVLLLVCLHLFHIIGIWFLFNLIRLFFNYLFLIRVFLDKFFSDLVFQGDLPLYFVFIHVDATHLIIRDFRLLQQRLHLPRTERILFFIGLITHIYVFARQFLIKQNGRLAL